MSLEFSSLSLKSVSSVALPERIVSRAAKVTPDLLPEVMEKHLQQLSTSEQNWWPAWRHRDAVSVTYERPFLPTLHRHPMAGLRHPPRVLLREQGKGRGGEGVC